MADPGGRVGVGGGVWSGPPPTIGSRMATELVDFFE